MFCSAECWNIKFNNKKTKKQTNKKNAICTQPSPSFGLYPPLARLSIYAYMRQPLYCSPHARTTHTAIKKMYFNYVTTGCPSSLHFTADRTLFWILNSHPYILIHTVGNVNNVFAPSFSMFNIESSVFCCQYLTLYYFRFLFKPADCCEVSRYQ